jgi:AcrR family transcriptional regulator
MSTGLLFHYFASKEELYLELVSLGIEGPMNSVQPGRMAPLEFFEVTAEQILNYIRLNPFVAKMFVFYVPGILWRRRSGKREGAAKRIRRVFADCGDH